MGRQGLGEGAGAIAHWLWPFFGGDGARPRWWPHHRVSGPGCHFDTAGLVPCAFHLDAFSNMFEERKTTSLFSGDRVQATRGEGASCPERPPVTQQRSDSRASHG